MKMLTMSVGKSMLSVLLQSLVIEYLITSILGFSSPRVGLIRLQQSPTKQRHHQQRKHDDFLSPMHVHNNRRTTPTRNERLFMSQSENENKFAPSSNNDDENNKRLEGVVCLVTGASRGIGKGIAMELGKEGATVYVTGTSSSSSNSDEQNSQADLYSTNPNVGGPGTVEETAQEVTRLGGRGIPVVCNHANDEQVQKLMQKIHDEQDGRLDILVNNVFRVPSPQSANGTSVVKQLFNKFWQEGSIETWDAVHTVGLRSHFVATHYAMPLLFQSASNENRKIPRPFIAMISSFGGLTYTFNVPYGVGKAGVDRLAKDMSMELQSHDICVTSFYPGLVQTERTDEMVANGQWQTHVGLPLDLAESPRFTGRAIVAVALDSNNLVEKSGTSQVVAELAQEYNLVDVNGKRPPSIRSLKFLIPTYGISDPEMRKQIPDWIIPDWKLPFWIMAGGRPPESTNEPRQV